MPTEIQQLEDKMNVVFESFKEYRTKADAQYVKYGEELGDVKESTEKVQDALDLAEKEFNRKLAELKALPMIGPPGNGSQGPIAEAKEFAADPACKAFNHYAHAGNLDGLDDSQKQLLVFPESSRQKAIATDSARDGGFLMPPAARGRFIEKLLEEDPVRQLANVETVSIGDSWQSPAEGDQNFDAGWTAEREDRPETATGQVRMDTIPAHELYARPLVTQKSLDDMPDVLPWLNRRLNLRLSIIQSAAFVSGDGRGKPEGFLNNETVLNNHVVDTGDANLITGDGLMNIYYDLPTPYARNAVWLLHRLSIRDIRKLKVNDEANHYAWSPAFEGEPPRILERPYREAPSMPLAAAGTYPVALGFWNRAYTIVDRQTIRVLRDPYSSKPFVEFYTTMRVGGAVVLPEAIRLQRVAA